MELHLFIACFILFLLSFGVAARLFLRRVADIKKGDTDPRYYKTYDIEAEIPRQTRLLDRHYLNLFESPILFYAIIALILAMDLAHISLVVLAYVYVGVRLIHSYIHLTKNKVWPRAITFVSSFFVLLALWTNTLILVLF